MASGVELEDVRLDSETETETASQQMSDTESRDQEKATPTEEVKLKCKGSKLTLVDAAQYGNLNRCRELVEREGADVTAGDDEDITPLHWAAINNRIPVVSYFLQKGANINAVGGELRSPPLHWATRQGHLSMVVHLLRYGARPEMLDGEGLNCLHIAAQFGLTGIMGYYICCRTPMHVDCLDTTGRTPLMHAAARANRSSDTTRLLAALGANIHATDKNKDTPLHHAAANLNYGATKVLIDAGAAIEVKNNDGKTPYDLAMENQNVYDMDQLVIARQKRAPRGVLEYVTRDPRFCWWLMVMFPIAVLGAIGWLGVICPNWWTYFIASTLLGAVTRKFLMVYLRVLPDNNPMAFGIVLGTKLWLYVTAMGYFYTAGTLQHYIWMHVALFVTMAVFYRLTKSDPGLIPRCKNPLEAHRTFTELCERGQYSDSAFCTTCLVRRPLRSKHCAACNQCVARFDHHCPWINNCVGLRNHKIFLAYLVCLLFMLTWGAKASILYLYQLYPATHGNFLVRGFHYITVEPWVGFIMIMCFVHMTWVYILLLAQLFQMICQGVTTNEMRNRYRYGHFSMFEGVNPFHRGVLTNCVEFFGFTCCQDSDSVVDWTKTYNLPKNFNKELKRKEDPMAKAKIPLPFSATWDPSNDRVRSGAKLGRGTGMETGYGSSEDESTTQHQFTANQEYTI